MRSSTLLLCLLATTADCRNSTVRLKRQYSNQEDCRTPDGSVGMCTPLPECPVVMDTFRIQTPTVCGWIRDMPVVCCPNPTLTRLIGSTSCGTRSISKRQLMFIAGGQQSAHGRWPWQAGIYYTVSSGVETHICGASIINSKHLVSAGHCFLNESNDFAQPDRFSVRVGSMRIMEGAKHLIDEIIFHPQYFPKQGFYNDIAVLRLKEPISFNSDVRPVCLPTSPDIRRKDLTDREVTVTGWGQLEFGGEQPTILREVTLKVISPSSCAKSIQTDINVVPRGITPQMICAAAPEGGKDACRYDSGGPLVLMEDSVWVLVGVVSFGFQCSRLGIPSVYTRVTDYVDWVEQVSSAY